MTLEGRFSHGGNVETFVAAFAVCIGFRDDSWIFLDIFLNGHNIKRVHLCSKLKIMKIKNHNIA
jgi:hypothetical protein